MNGRTLDGLAAIVTGAARGMGREFALRLAEAGAAVALCDINGAEAEETARLIAGERPAYAARTDVSDPAQVRSFVQAAGERLGAISVLVNNAAVHPLTAVEDITVEEWDRVLAVNIRAYFLFAQALLPGMKARRFGRIINIASEAGKNGGTVCALHYAASKGAVLAFTRNLAKQVGEHGITVNAIAPGRIDTAMANAASPEQNSIYVERSAVKRLGSPSDVARAVLFLADPKAGFVTGETLNVNGGTLMD